MSDVGGIASERLRSFINRIRNLRAEVKSINEDVKEVFAEAKGTGFDTKIMRKIISWMDAREKNAADQQEQEALFDLYKEALGYGEGSAVDIPLNPTPAKKGKKATPAPAVDPDQIDIEDHLVNTPAASSGTDDAFDPAPDLQPAEPTPAPVSADEAKAMGHAAGAAGVPITGNPFDAADPNRGHWELGWCEETGSDGMDIPQAPQPAKGGKPRKGAKGGKGGKGSTDPQPPASPPSDGDEWQNVDNNFSSGR
ncbi:DUF2312 domain-containing protein [Azospirillum sp. HJ39]|uniref:DUF2312 domain-containing protein n=1 Tax=Azospirillum sp. HJ39 TaxID=3159496 RepID=UPI0035583DB6